MTYEEIKRLLKTSIGSRFLGRKEVKELPSILWEDEIPKNLVGGNGILVVTDKRLIFINKGIFSLKVKYFLHEEVSYIEEIPRITTGEIVVYAGEEKAKIKRVDRTVLRMFLTRLESKD
ncbi:PH domain-containing protein [Shimazuella kribbensis]|uniref:PH domain-containing protein n=1 Tax=Shimazuella kribbensis TaxID=139808 RepID=UPI0003F4E5C1|nr:PH domain-containing protein [Shimazuella kribbensis]